MVNIEELKEWLNKWGDFDKHKQTTTSDGKYITKFGEGYKQAIRDVFDKLEKGN